MNPNDYVLVREVYGDSSANTIGNNGGAQVERVALVVPPGGSVPPLLFTVYPRGVSRRRGTGTTGPVPASQIQDIERVEVKVRPCCRPRDGKRHHPTTTLSTQINSMRSVPDWGVATYTVSGYASTTRTAIAR